MRFADIIGHEELKKRLTASVEAGRISHALLFSGASGAGSLPLALAYAQYLNCPNRHDGDSCGECANCVQTSTLAHPDVHWVFPVNKANKKSTDVMLSDNFLPQWREAFEQTGGYFNKTMWGDKLQLTKMLQPNIAVAEAGEIIRKLSFKSFEAEYKIVIIWLPESMNEQAQNKILKIVEEPWDKTIFLMVSVEANRILPTIISRTQEIVVHNVAPDELMAHLTTQGVEPQRASQVVRLSRGDMLEVGRLLTQSESERNENFELFKSLMRSSYANRLIELLEWAEQLSPLTRQAQLSFLRYAQAMLRESYILNAGGEQISYLWGEEADFCKKFSPFIGNHNVENIVRELESCAAQISANGDSLIVFTHMALKMSKLIPKV